MCIKVESAFVENHTSSKTSSEYTKMIKVVCFAALFVAVLAHGNHRPPMPPGPPPAGEQGQGQASLDEPHIRVARQMPQMPQMPHMPQMPGGMNPAQFPQMMGEMAQKGIGMMTSMMDPNKWMGAASQMMPKPNKK